MKSGLLSDLLLSVSPGGGLRLGGVSSPLGAERLEDTDVVRLAAAADGSPERLAELGLGLTLRSGSSLGERSVLAAAALTLGWILGGFSGERGNRPPKLSLHRSSGGGMAVSLASNC